MASAKIFLGCRLDGVRYWMNGRHGLHGEGLDSTSRARSPPIMKANYENSVADPWNRMQDSVVSDGIDLAVP